MDKLILVVRLRKAEVGEFRHASAAIRRVIISRAHDPILASSPPLRVVGNRPIKGVLRQSPRAKVRRSMRAVNGAHSCQDDPLDVLEQ
jgi:hypothetical protein